MTQVQKWLEQGHILQIKADGIFVSGKPATFYHGIQIKTQTVNALGKDFEEIQVMQSSTKGRFAEPGKPVPAAKGPYNWIRAKNSCGVWSDWLMRSEGVSFDGCTKLQSMCIATDANLMQNQKRPDFRNAVLQNIKKKVNIGKIISALQQSKTR